MIAESEPLELSSGPPGAPYSVRPALALAAAEEVQTIRRVLLEAATSTTRETWATCSCPECCGPAANACLLLARARGTCSCHTSSMMGALCSAKLRSGDPCRSVATQGEFCGYHRALAEELGYDLVANGDQTKRRNARQREPVIAESEPLELPARSPGSPSAVRPALALTAAEEVETIRRVLLDAATSTTRESWATCTCPECGKGFRQEIFVPDHGARIYDTTFSP